VPVAEGMVLTISLGVVLPPGNTVAYDTSVEINGIPVITCNGAGQVATLVGWMEVMGHP